MQRSTLRTISHVIAEEYEIFSHLSLGSRLLAVLAVTLFYFSLVIITHLTLLPYLVDSYEADLTFTVIYLYVFIMAVLNILPILFPNLKEKLALAVFAILSLNFFPIIPLAFLLPQFRKYKRLVIATTIYLVLCVVGLVLMFEGEYEGILMIQPPITAVILWLLGMNAIFMGTFIYSYVTEKVSVQKTRIETEINIARNIQSQLVPVVRLASEQFQLFAETKSASQIGGDFFDVVQIEDKKVLLAIGDVSGHNIAAGLLMAIAKGAFRTAIQHTTQLEELAASMNRTIVQNSDKRMFVSFLCAELDFASNSMKLLDAGHLPLLHYRRHDGVVDELTYFGLAFGLSEEADYEAHTISYEKGDHLFFFTDGIVEAMNPSKEQFGFERLKDVVVQSAETGDPETIHKKLFDALDVFTGEQLMQDDATFLSIRIA